MTTEPDEEIRPDAAKRLVKARLLRGFPDAKAAATYFGWVYDTYSQHERGLRGLSRVAERYAKAFRVSEGWLLTGEGPDPKRVPVVGYVGAGGIAHFYSGADAPNETARAPTDAGDKTVAVVIRGHSLGPLLDGYVAYYDDVRADPESLVGKLCIVTLTDDRVLIKSLQKGDREGTWTLHSAEPPIYDVRVRWAAEVKSMLSSYEADIFDNVDSIEINTGPAKRQTGRRRVATLRR